MAALIDSSLWAPQLQRGIDPDKKVHVEAPLMLAHADAHFDQIAELAE